jgi:RecA/RadA recombinase
LKKVQSPIQAFVKKVKTKDALTLNDESLFTKHIETGVYALNGILSGDMFGGLETGRTTELAGESSSGKSAIANYLMEKFLNEHPETGIVILYETEGRVSESLTNIISPQFRERVIVVPTYSVDEINEDMLGNLKTNLDKAKEEKQEIHMMIVLDSLGNLGTAKELKDSTEGKNSTVDMKRAQQIKKLFRTITIPFIAKHQIPFIVINHVYDVIGSYVPMKKQGGGKGVEYLSNNIIEVANIKSDKEVKGIKKKSAFRLRVVKSLTLDKGTTLTVYFNNGHFEKYSSILNVGEELKVLETRNAGSKGKVFKYKDKEYSKKDLASDPNILEDMMKEINNAWREEHSFTVNSVVDDFLEDEEETQETENISEEEVETSDDDFNEE